MKNLFLFVMIILPTVLFAQNITVSGLVVTEGSPSTVTFDVSWEKPATGTVWMDSAWVFVDYNKNGRMVRLPLLLSSGATLTATSAPGEGKLEEVSGNDKGAWVAGYARYASLGSFSAKVMLLSDEEHIAGACAYASGYPPVGEYLDDTKLQFTGTPMYKIWLNSASGPEMIETGGLFFIPCGYTIESFTDKTGAPGIFKCIRPTNHTLSGADVCEGAAVTLTLSGSQSEFQYQLYNGDAPVGAPKDGTGGVLNFNGEAAVGGYTYTVRTVGGGSVRCNMPVSNVLNVTVNPQPADLLFTATPAAICIGESTTLTASTAPISGASYSIDNNLWQTTPEFNVSPPSDESYTLYVKTAAGCTATKANAALVTVYSAFSAGAITSAAITTMINTNPGVTIANSTAASGGNGSITYEWRRSGTSSKTLGGSNAITYAIGSDASNYSTAGTYYFNRYAKDATCNTAFVAATGTYTLTVAGPPGTFPTTLCAQCCYNGTAWVNCYVTANAYPFDTDATNTKFQWIGSNEYGYFGGADSDKNGRQNNVPGSGGAGAVCRNLGTGWYLPAYEELYAMSAGAAHVNSNNLSGAKLLDTPAGDYWSSTDYYNNVGRHTTTSSSQNYRAVVVNSNGTLNNRTKADSYYVRCAWRPL
jgi:hypothetical protein